MSYNGKDSSIDSSEIPSSESKNKPKSHRLVVTTFSSPTNCDNCGKFIWGLIKQGMTCQTCGFVCDPSCAKKVFDNPCLSRASDFEYESFIDSLPKESKETKKTKTSSKGSNSLGLNVEQPSVIHNLINGDIQSQPIAKVSTDNTVKTIEESLPEEPTSSSTSTDSKRKSTNDQQYKESKKRDHKEILSTLRRSAKLSVPNVDSGRTSPSIPPVSPKASFDTFLKEVMNSTKEKERQLAETRNLPALNILSTTLPNFTQFVPRLTAPRQSFEVLFSIFTWENPTRSWFFLFCYVNVCLRPEWLILIPFIALWLNIVNDYFTEINNSSPKGEETKAQTEPPVESGYGFGSDKFRSSILGPDVALARATASKYVQNVQLVQNIMGWYVKSYDETTLQWENLKKLLGPNWPLWLTSTIIPVALVVLWYIPKYLIFLFSGSSALLANHPFFTALVGSLASRLSDGFGHHLSSVTQAFKVRVLDVTDSKNGKGHITVNIFENQRWWAVIGWNERTISTERDSWSDESGNIQQTPIFLQQPEPGYSWEENSEWKLVYEWCQPVNTDKKGWVYYNNQWKGPSTRPRVDSFTRRRLWTRKMVSQSSPPDSPPKTEV